MQVTARLLSFFRDRLGVLFLWLVSIASISFYLSYMAASGERNVLNKKRLELSVALVDSNYSEQIEANSGGYILANHYSDIHRGSAINLASLQCWTSSIPGRVRIVEPFLRQDSVLGVSLTGSEKDGLEPNSIKFSQVYDKTEWSISMAQRDYTPLVSWKYFIKYSPRRLILVDKSCDNSSHICMQCSNGFYKSNVFQFAASEFTRQHGFTVVRRVCYRLMPYSAAELQALIYGPYKPDEVVVLFNHFGGLVSSKDKYRIQMQGRMSWRCKRHLHIMPTFSSEIRVESDEYVRTFMPNAGTNQYISVVLFMKYFLTSKALENLSEDQQMLKMLSCISEVAEKVESLRRKRRIDHVFVSADVGKYGSVDVSNFKKFRMKESVFRRSLDKLQSRIDSSSSKFDDGSVKLESVSFTRSQAYMVALERSVLARGECLVVVGEDLSLLEMITLHEHQNSQYSRRGHFCGVHQVCTNI